MTIQYLIAFPTGSVNSVRTVPCSPLNGQPQLWAWNMVGTQEMFLEYKNESRGGGLETSACKAVLCVQGCGGSRSAKDGWMGWGMWAGTHVTFAMQFCPRSTLGWVWGGETGLIDV